jgi:hypothetical protein
MVSHWHNSLVSYLSPDLRPAFVLNDVIGAEFIHVKGQHEPNVQMIVLKNVTDFREL